MLPEDNVGGDTVLTVAEEDNPGISMLGGFGVKKVGIDKTYIPSGSMDSPMKNS